MHKLLKKLDEKNIDSLDPGATLMIEDEGTYEFCKFLHYDQDSSEVVVLDYAMNDDMFNQASYPIHRMLIFDTTLLVSSDEYLSSIER